MPIFVIWGQGLRKRAGRSEPKWLGNIEAASQVAAERVAAEKWPGIRLLISEQSRDLPTTPKTGCRSSDS